MLRRHLAEQKMAPHPQHHDLPHLESVSRIAKLPVVEASWLYASSLYTRLKRSSPLVRWGLTTTESTVQGALGKAVHVAVVFQKPLHLVDVAVCRGLDVVEESLHVPGKVLVLTKDLVSSTVVRPVLKRADSVLASKYTCFAAETVDFAIDIADKYVDTYLPSDIHAGGGAEDNCQEDGKPVVVHTMRHVNRFSRKLQRRLTQRTLAEVNALRHLSEELILTLLQLAKLMATDPKAVRDKVAVLWMELSEDRPKEQAWPPGLEGLVVMVAREAARRGVRLANYASVGLVTLPHQLANYAALLADYVSVLMETLLETCHLEKPKDQAVAQVRDQVVKFQHIIDQINSYIIHVLVKEKGQNLVPCPPRSPLNKKQERCNVTVRYGCMVHCRLFLTVALSCSDSVVIKAESSKRKNGLLRQIERQGSSSSFLGDT